GDGWCASRSAPRPPNGCTSSNSGRPCRPLPNSPPPALSRNAYNVPQRFSPGGSMTLGRRDFLAGAGTLALSARSVLAAAQTSKPGAIFPPSVRADFPSVSTETYMNSAAMHPIGTFAARGVEQALNYRLHGPGPGRTDFGADKQQDLKKRYGQLINATANEIAYTANTSDGENIVV